MHGRNDLRAAYRASLRDHRYQPDPAQEQAIEHLEDLRLRLQRAAAGRNSWLTRLAARFRPAAGPPMMRGVYLWGGVGRGKTYLMDLFHAHAGVPVRREHFHRFMKEVHGRLHGLRELPDPLPRVAAEMTGDASALCLDELYVSDIADAMILAGLFDAFVRRGVVLVCTSNTPPGGLYRDGLQRGRFLPAIALLERHNRVVNVESGTDYRLRQLEKAPLYVDAGQNRDAWMQERFAAIAGDPGLDDGSIVIEGRPIPARRVSADVVWFDFAAICDGPRSQSDYVEIARDYHTVLVSDVPRFDAAADDQARRFIALVDELYDRSVKLVLTAAGPPERLYGGERLAFEFERTRSRLVEMQTHDYLARPHKG
jgi:cell division protein ZapE